MYQQSVYYIMQNHKTRQHDVFNVHLCKVVNEYLKQSQMIILNDFCQWSQGQFFMIGRKCFKNTQTSFDCGMCRQKYKPHCNQIVYQSAYAPFSRTGAAMETTTHSNYIYMHPAICTEIVQLLVHPIQKIFSLSGFNFPISYFTPGKF